MKIALRKLVRFFGNFCDIIWYESRRYGLPINVEVLLVSKVTPNTEKGW